MKAEPSWSSPIEGALWSRTIGLGEWLIGPVTPLFATTLLPALVDGREQGGWRRWSWGRRKPVYCVLNGYYYWRQQLALDWTLSYKWLRMLADFLGRFERLWRQDLLPTYLSRVEALHRVSVEEASDGELLAALNKLSQYVGEYWFSLSLLGGTAERQIVQTLERIRGWTPSLWEGFELLDLFRGFKSRPLENQQRLYDLSRLAVGSAELRELLSHPPGEVLPALQRKEAGRRFAQELEACIREFGHQVFNLDFYFPTLGEQPERLIAMVKRLADSDAQDPEIVREQQEKAREEAESLLRHRIGRRIWLRPVMAIVKTGQDVARVREDAVFYLQISWPLMRELISELSSRLVLQGKLRRSELIFFLEKGEVKRLIEGGAGDMTEKAEARERAWRQQHRLQAPAAIPPLSDPAWKDWRSLEPSNRVLHQLAISQRESPRVVAGLPASPGKVSGRAVILRSEEEFDRLERGDILVAVTTNPAWTPLFSLAAAVVTEVGGPLAHASIVAREFGIPAVVATQNATSAINDGDVITVDGSAGLVYLHSSAD